VIPVGVLVVYESVFGNTRQVAEAVAGGLAGTGTGGGVAVLPVEEAAARLPEDVDLLVVGGPTHAFGMTRAKTRQDAAARPGAVSAGRIGIREWLERLDVPRPGVPAATFDTRIRKPRLPGSAAKGAARRLRSLGLRLVAPPESFWVRDTGGPLYEGERERAEHWGAGLAALGERRAAPAPGAEAGGAAG
jgi:hypothetical protein